MAGNPAPFKASTAASIYAPPVKASAPTTSPAAAPISKNPPLSMPKSSGAVMIALTSMYADQPAEDTKGGVYEIPANMPGF
jgi:hypothetical protein